MTPKQQPAPDFGEPWRTAFSYIYDREDFTITGFKDRIVACVNACAGMAAPEAEIQAMREAIKKAERFIHDIVTNHECGDITDASGLAVLDKLQPFLP